MEDTKTRPPPNQPVEHPSDVTQLSSIPGDVLLKRQLNATRPISQLPEEIFAEIFLCCRDAVLDEAQSEGVIAPNAWIYVTHVCHSWRALALSLPCLWNHIETAQEEVTKAFIARSLGAPLDIENMAYPDYDPDLLPVLLQELPRIRRLEIALNHAFFETHTWVGLPAPELRSVTIEISDTYQAMSLADFLLRSHLPALQHFCIKDSYWYWSRGAFPTSLTSLYITGHSWLSSAKRAHETVSLLARLPLLEQLSLRDASPPEREISVRLSAEVDGLPVVTLPKLQHLELAGTPLTCLHHVKHLSIPPQCRLLLDMKVVSDIAERLDALTRLANESIITGKARASCPLTELSIESSRWHMLKLYLWTPTCPPRPIRPGLSPVLITFDRSLGSANQWFIRGTLLYGVLGALALSDVKVLEVAAMRGYAYMMDFRRVLGRMRNLETLHVDGWTISETLMLIPTRRGDDGDDDDELFMPRLRNITLTGVSFPVRPAHPDEQQYVVYWIDRLRARRDRGAAINKLVLERCYNLTQDIVDAMRQEVSIVDWDGIQQHGAMWDDMAGGDVDDDDDPMLDW